MALTDYQIANTTASAFEVRLQYFALYYTDFLGDYEAAWIGGTSAGALPNNWSATGDVITPGGDWHDVTNLVYHEGTFTHQVGAGTVNWTAQVRGHSYNDYFASGNMLLCCRRDITTDNDSGWYLWWCGRIEGGQYARDYQAGEPWQRTVRDISLTMITTDAPRLVVGPINLAEGASVSTSSYLLTPASEAGNGEFIGTTAVVVGDNITDANKNTVWISQDAPSSAGEDPALNALDILVIDEVFLWPVPGYSLGRSWWVELANTGPDSGDPIELAGAIDVNNNYVRTNYALYAWTTNGDVAMLSFGQPYGELDKSISFTLGPGERMVICADRRVFESMFGGSNSAKYIIEAKSWGTVAPNEEGYATTTYREFTPDQVNGFIALGTPWNELLWGFASYDAVTIGDGAALIPSWMQKRLTDGSYRSPWVGDEVDVTGVAEGQSIRRKPTFTDTDTNADWAIEIYPRPGRYWTPNTVEWAKLLLPEHTSTLGADFLVKTGDTLTISEGTTGWPDASSDKPQSGLLDYEAFTYTGRTANTLTGVTGLTADHITGSPLWPLDANGDAMTGWQVSTIELYRPSNLSYYYRARLYLSRFADAGDCTDDDWESDYDDPIYILLDINRQTVWDISLRLNNWVRTILFVIDEMDDGGRAKSNEIIVTLNAATINDSGKADVGSSTASSVIEYILNTYSPMTTDLVVTDSTPTGWGTIGRLALAIAPLPGVMADLARMHGVIVCWQPRGYVELIADPWWPGGKSGTSWLYQFTKASVRGEVRFSDRIGEVTGLTLNATSSDGTALAPETVLVSGTTNSSTVLQVNGYTCASQEAALNLAWNLLWKELGNNLRASWTVAGIGEWCAPLDRYLLTWGDDNYGQFLAEKVTTTWGPGRWETRIDAVSYFTPS